jgi:hypothetical protein
VPVGDRSVAAFRKEAEMNTLRIKLLARVVGGIAVVLAIAANVGTAHTPNLLAGGSGDSTTTGGYTSPAVPAMSVDPKNMNMGATVTDSPAAATPVTAEATPSVKATAAPECVNNGQCP